METRTKHLTVGSPQPSKADGLRLYSFELCPYAERVRLVLQFKNLKYEAVNINLNKKPEWFLTINPAGKVPALDTGNEIITESLVIVKYLEEKYPTPALYPAEPEDLKKTDALISKIEIVTSVFYKCLMKPEDKTPEEWVKEFLTAIEPFETELRGKRTTYFAGENPGIVDFMLWPWAEKAKALGMVLGQKLPFADNDIPNLIIWQKSMKSIPAVQAVYNSPEKFFKCLQLRKSTDDVDFDSI
ncbi:hypothetical protein WA026_019967 [Henosepilachna vigintioctopunctata]|uniref:Uncharacterized protein n=1 Tax=Henosepilachna vigintioctopunctata TaxID=420089 RepID=A0AAW1V427_9CUCU